MKRKKVTLIMERDELVIFLSDAIDELKKIYSEPEALKLIMMDIANYKELCKELNKAEELIEKENEYRDLVLELSEYEESKELRYYRNFYSEEELSDACNLVKEKLKKYK